MAHGPTTVVIAAEWALIRAGVRHALTGDPSIEVVGEGGTELETVTLVQRLKPDVLILSFRPSVPAALDLARRIQANETATRVMVIASEFGRTDVSRAMSAGVVGYLLESAQEAELTGAVHSMTRGNAILPAAVAEDSLPPGSVGRQEGLPKVPLSERELVILRLAAQGLRNKEIGERLELSTRTVQGHMTRVLKKLNAKSRVQALLSAASHGLIEFDDSIR